MGRGPDSNTGCMATQTVEIAVRAIIRAELLRLARQLECLADDEAARVPYWQTTPASVIGRRAAARALEAEAEALLGFLDAAVDEGAA